jgi:phage I-like protein
LFRAEQVLDLILTREPASHAQLAALRHAAITGAAGRDGVERIAALATSACKPTTLDALVLEFG